jgi:hypothetical protein
MTPLEKAFRILPSCVSPTTKSSTDLATLRLRVQKDLNNLQIMLMEKINETHSGTFNTKEAKEIDRKVDQLQRFLEATNVE